ncbi:hypothetical protein SARC_11608 [Sphaeroforma arctica JP610]|uniref:Uncharacterized protein n=1 Tax=Sphaeroforma arctica JP610 TaxID=667725 RepID=A0A0L0FIJ9_9EUKA|nr:hypothetical protein SARC_11608 [Sphaeroforma arctica JP610]KNC75873.1 hypothetical protein SARC_11608 [Sphaeroforma arctica JP610]|eukprot:XP_014149775.1 hypothetical protein SARC_11608 [Sphaeroforma arctica JP610]
MDSNTCENTTIDGKILPNEASDCEGVCEDTSSNGISSSVSVVSDNVEIEVFKIVSGVAQLVRVDLPSDSHDGDDHVEAYTAPHDGASDTTVNASSPIKPEHTTQSVDSTVKLPNGGRIPRDKKKNKKKAKKIRELKEIELDYDGYRPFPQYPRAFLGAEAQQHTLDNAYFEGNDKQGVLAMARNYLEGKKKISMGALEYQALAYACDVYVQLKQPQNALELIEKCRLKPQQLDSYMVGLMAECYESLEKWDQYLEMRQHLVCIEKSNARSWVALADTYLKIARINSEPQVKGVDRIVPEGVAQLSAGDRNTSADVDTHRQPSTPTCTVKMPRDAGTQPGVNITDSTMYGINERITAMVVEESAEQRSNNSRPLQARSKNSYELRAAEVCLRHALRLLHTELVTAKGFAVARINKATASVHTTFAEYGWVDSKPRQRQRHTAEPTTVECVCATPRGPTDTHSPTQEGTPPDGASKNGCTGVETSTECTCDAVGGDVASAREDDGYASDDDEKWTVKGGLAGKIVCREVFEAAYLGSVRR